MVKTLSRQELAECLLIDWYEWSSNYRPNLGIPKCSPEFRQSRSSRQWDSTGEIVDDICYKVTMEAVEWCVDSLPAPMQNAIGVEMRNKKIGKYVWRPMMGATYGEALTAIIPKMREKNLID